MGAALDDVPEWIMYLVIPTIAMGLAAFAHFAHGRSTRRRNPDKVGLVAWDSVYVAAFLVGVFSLAYILAMHGRGTL